MQDYDVDKETGVGWITWGFPAAIVVIVIAALLEVLIHSHF